MSLVGFELTLGPIKSRIVIKLGNCLKHNTGLVNETF